MHETYDVVVVGGGAAGLSGALALARSRRSVLLFDSGDPRNATAGHVHNVLSRDGTPPSELYEAGRRELSGYGVSIVPAHVDSVARAGDRFVLTAGDLRVHARRVLFATGTRDELPDVPGLRARWGRDVLHCPYCHGWEFRDRRIGVLATAPNSVHQALLFRNLSEHITVIEHGPIALSGEEREQLAALAVEIRPGPAVELLADEDGPLGIRLGDGSLLELDAVVVAPVCRARAELLVPLGIEPVELTVGDMLLGTQIPVDATGKAGPGVWAAGNLADIRAHVMTSAAAGVLAGAAVNIDLVLSGVIAARSTPGADAAAAPASPPADATAQHDHSPDPGQPAPAPPPRTAPPGDSTNGLAPAGEYTNAPGSPGSPGRPPQTPPAPGHPPHTPGHPAPSPPPHTPAEWDERYAGQDRVWSGEPNGALVREAAGLTPGRAVDVGCGEGDDAIWLAGQGWTVTALDVSTVAIDRARARAAAAGAEVTWLTSGLLDAELDPRGFDLVSVQYPALSRTPGADAERRLLDLVAPGGTLLVVHHEFDGGSIEQHRAEHGWSPADYVMPGDVASLLDDGWAVEVDETRDRRISGGSGAHHARDVVLRARREERSATAERMPPVPDTVVP